VWHRAFYIITLLALTLTARSQVLTYNFTDPCTKVVNTFNIPVTGTTTIYFLNRTASFTAADVSSGAFGVWINTTYSDYRKISPCGQQSGQVTQNQITSQIIGNTVQSVVGSIMASAQSQATSSVVSSATSSSIPSASSASSNSNTTTSSTSSSSDKKASAEESQEVAGSTTMSSDASSDKSGGGSSSGSSKSSGGSKSSKSGGKGGMSNPILVSSDFTTAQNLNKTFTPILNLSMSQSSLTGKVSWGMTGMIWFNFKQFALSGKYTKMYTNKKGSVKYISNYALTAVYSYGNILGFIGYSGILNLGKYGVTGFNLSGAASVISEDKSTFFSPSITAFYTKPLMINKRLTISPELYIISTPLIYSAKDKVTQSDRTFSFFAGAGFDYQISKKFKFNVNYKLNASTNREFPILSFFMIGSKVNL
jgi:hypothetical protein